MTNKIELEHLFNKKGLTKKKVAEHLSITVQGLDKKLNNETELKASEIYKLAGILGIEVGNPVFFNQGVN